MKTKSNLERILEAGHFAVTGEIGPPVSADPEVVRRKVKVLKGNVDAFNVTDGQGAVVRMSSWAACLIGKEEGLDPIVQMTCRDRNRIALQMDVLGIAALGINNILCLTGDHQKLGNHPAAKGVYDLDSVQLVKVVKDMRDEKKLQCGDEIDIEPRLFIGAAANPFAPPFEFRVMRLAKKIAAGADFIQTQVIYDVDRFAEWMKMVRDRGLHEKVKILAGVAPIRSLSAARYMKTKIPGMDVPQKLVDRMDAAVENIPDPKIVREPKERKELSRRRREAGEAEGIKICQETIQQLRQIEGVAGIHIMAIGWEEVVPEIVKDAGLLPRPRLVL